jgi:tRNA (guanine37-N1)-methyltransferase
MEVPCVRAAREDGETIREHLAERALLDHDHEITVADGLIYVPVTDAEAVPEEYSVVTHDAPAREMQAMPADLLGFEPTYERLGDIVLIDEDDPDRAEQIGAAVMESALPVKTVLNRASKVTGEFRTREWEHLAGNGTRTVHREYGCAFALDVAEVYFSPRLATERHRVTEKIDEGECVVDMFAGVGPFAIPAAERGAEVVAVDVNPVAIEYLRENARRNGVENRIETIEGDVRAVAADEYENWADRLVMNLPHSADEFLDAAVRLAGADCLIHYYDIQHESNLYKPGERAIREAADGYDVTVESRQSVRSYAPHELNIRLDARLRA